MTRLLYALRSLFRIQIKHPRYHSEDVNWTELRNSKIRQLAREIGNPNHRALTSSPRVGIVREAKQLPEIHRQEEQPHS